jgi:hypothetical protein
MDKKLNLKRVETLFSTFGMSESEIKTAIEELHDENEKPFESEAVILAKAKEYGLTISSADIKKQLDEARKSGSSGTILKTLKAVYDSLKEDGKVTETFDEWKKLNESKDYADLIKEQFTSYKTAGLSESEALKLAQKKAEDAIDAYNKLNGEFDNFKTEIVTKERLKKRDELLRAELEKQTHKPIHPKSYNSLVQEENENGVIFEYDENKNSIVLLDKETSTPALRNGKPLTITQAMNEYATKYAHEFINSEGSRKVDESDIKIDDKTKLVETSNGKKLVGF